MTEHKNDDNIQSEIPSRPEGQDTSEDMDHKTPHDPTADDTTTHEPGTTEVLPAVRPEVSAAATPPTQEIASSTQRIPEGPAPEGEVHPAYGVAAARVAESSGASTAGPSTGLTQVVAPVHQGQSAQERKQGQPGQPATPPAGTRRARVGTAVWGLIVIAVGLGILAVSAGVIFDLGVALIVLLGAAGVILVVGSVVSSLRRR